MYLAGSGSIEGHHNRLQNNMPGFSSAAIDQFANKLWDEETYYSKLMTTPHLWSEKKATHMAAVNRHLKNKRVLINDMEKTFNTHKIMRIEDLAWSIPMTTQGTFCLCFYISFYLHFVSRSNSTQIC